MWKPRFFCFLLLASSFGVNATDYAPRWSISGIDLFEELRLDLDLGTFAIAAHGILVFENGTGVPHAGSCFVNNAGGVTCAITTSQGLSLYFAIDDSLNGPIIEYSANGSETNRGTMTFLGLGLP